MIGKKWLLFVTLTLILILVSIAGDCSKDEESLGLPDKQLSEEIKGVKIKIKGVRS